MYSLIPDYAHICNRYHWRQSPEALALQYHVCLSIPVSFYNGLCLHGCLSVSMPVYVCVCLARLLGTGGFK